MSQLSIAVQGQEFTVDARDGQYLLLGTPNATVTEISPGVFSVIIQGKSFRVLVSREGESYAVYCGGVAGRVQVETERSRLLKKFAGAGGGSMHKAEIYAPMHALVVSVEVKPGESVEKGQGLVVLEAMKMENELRAPQAGVVRKVLVEKGAKVEKGELMLLLE